MLLGRCRFHPETTSRERPVVRCMAAKNNINDHVPDEMCLVWYRYYKVGLLEEHAAVHLFFLIRLELGIKFIQCIPLRSYHETEMLQSHFSVPNTYQTS